ncbi:MAG: formate/nitrite transporter family protein [Clostridia bacterium]|nr:formate/nitrite transporter family protein [Clostridia bacterium]MBR4439853.1 formate/nitrite transporter family protein [Clostridia bacterium]MBR5769495.1 formate/nitrite transporter family protein [Clostridia bacterium]MBR5942726.1 formate/nitrite transporter family protein [Clostridia bacterium]
MVKQAKIFVQAIAAGLMISIGGTVYMICPNKLLGAFMFALGLFMVCVWKFNLFTGKIGYVVEDKTTWASLAQIWIGNLCGALLAGYGIRATRMLDKMTEAVTASVEAKLGDAWYSTFVLAIFCGMLMFLAVDTFKTVESGFMKTIAVILPIAVFIVAGFNHCIADMYYISAANMWSLKAVGYVLLVTAGNAVGSVIIALFKKFR